ncbi:conserved hypothetical protein [Talaromyces stipitatus ATCC 10500]|uniref:Domain of unknown function at the cortex 1 domain-containing protein n=1 Tax=Talaromyces stipitatus (strain ATCC 10500 / CBS 375.48 / QM 6759 / NRRL 1006) TaxID=441959 RepID=B8MGU0_TALSN|nr:uncharacterized protein TSTA_014170 [Talaromyces stipitatus ATCC 10500]EED16321.1 conserved hypothetical protein [Talaromyces stipitatus ATCC 10500]
MPTPGSKSPVNYRLRVTAGPEYALDTHRVVPVNADKTLRIENELAIIYLCVRIQDYTGLPNGSPKTSKYFSHPLHESDQYSISFILIPKQDISGNDLVWGNDFNRPIRDSIPPGFNTALRIVKWAIDPGLDGDPYADKPYLYSPGLASWNYFRIGEKVGPEELSAGDEKKENVHDRISVVEEGAEGTGEKERGRLQIPNDVSQRKKYFLDENVRNDFVFEKGRQYLIDFGNPYLGFNDFTLRLPGFHLHVAKYIDARKHKLRYTLKNRKLDKTLLVVLFTLLVEGSEEEISERELSVGSGEDGNAGSSSKR